ncbi:MAG: ABC transporter ATP-binding protein [Ruminococcus sp.]|uniref:ABC transporter ATP-binding protein n=1 Tax=Ruminococcus sp. TaxID=41978 RepID=UPI0025D759D5|nr:ABC transporter ATP-binding protein [Ruminococcus sp.]MBO4865579.1 ABC transporter ATP-binding protein [Ruminococcus sp.]
MFQLRWLWANLKGSRAVYICALVLSVVCNGMFVAAQYFQSKIIDTFVSNKQAAENLRDHRDLLLWLIAGMIGVTLLRTSLTYTCNMYYEKASQAMIYRIRTHLFRKIENQDMDFYDRYRTGDLMTRLTGDLDMVRHMVSWVISNTVANLALFVASMVYFFTIDYRTALCIMTMTPVIFFVTRLFSRHAGPAYRKVRETSSALNTAAQENISGNRVVKAFAKEDYEIKKFRQKDEEYRESNIKAAMVWLKYHPFIDIAAGALSVILLICGGYFMIKQHLTMGQYVAISGLLWAVGNPMRNMGTYVNDFHRFMASAGKVIEIYYEAPRIVDREDAHENKEKLRGDIEFKNVTFSIGEKKILDNVSFKINAGETVVIMGETGSGKTTLVNLIPRFFDCDRGEVLVDGRNVRMHKLHTLRSSIGIATQDVLLYSDTIDSNIAYGDSDMEEEYVRRCAELSAASDFIEKLPDKYETIVGERGVGLSGGQKQRISLARAIAVRPAVLILDDTTSAVDMETEHFIQQSLSGGLDFECTKIIIAQRISSSKNADKIIILEDGKISDMGTHEELISREGYYRQIYELQSGINCAVESGVTV